MLSVKADKWPEKNPAEYLLSLMVRVKIGDPKPLFAKIPPETAETEKAKLNLENAA
jgi:hypothetical protein